MSNHNDYDASQIQVLEGLEAVKRRPGMYIGSTDVRGLHHLVKELVDNAIDEAMGGYCNHIEINIHKDNSLTVTDNGRGIPVDEHPKLHKSALEVALTVLHAGGKFGGSGYKVSGGLHGVGLSVVNALSTWLTVEVRRDNKIYRQEYRLGDPLAPVAVIGAYEGEESGTQVTFLANDEIFDEVNYNFDTMVNRMRELAFLNRGVHIILTDERIKGDKSEQTVEYYSEGGLIDFVKYLNQDRDTLFDTPINRNKDVLHPEPIYIEARREDPEKQESASLEVAMQYNDDYNENVFTFANNIGTVEGGSHLVGFRTALTRVVVTPVYIAVVAAAFVFTMAMALYYLNVIREDKKNVANADLPAGQLAGGAFREVFLKNLVTLVAFLVFVIAMMVLGTTAVRFAALQIVAAIVAAVYASLLAGGIYAGLKKEKK